VHDGCGGGEALLAFQAQRLAHLELVAHHGAPRDELGTGELL
jgi:hypothetical protein